MDIFRENNIEWEEIYEELFGKKISISIPNKPKKEVKINSKNFIEKLKNINSKNRVLFLMYYSEIEKELFSKKTVDMFGLNAFRSMKNNICNFMLNPEINNIDIRYINNEMIVNYYKKSLDKGKLCKYLMLTKFFDCIHKYMKNEVNIIKVEKILNTGIPKLREYCIELKDLNKEQKEFYLKWEENYHKDNYLDVKDNISYVFIYLYKIIEEFKKDRLISKLKYEFNKIKDGYGKYDIIKKYLERWEVDAYLYLRKFDMAWKLINKYNDYLSVSDLLIIKNHCKDKTWDSKQAVKLLGRKRFTDFFNNKLLNDDFYIY